MAISNIDCKIEYKKKDISSANVVKFLKNLEKYKATAGIHKEDGQKMAPYTDTRHQNVKLITKACRLEFGNQFTPKNNIVFKSYITGEWFMLKAGKTYIQERRPFIRLVTDNKAKIAISQTFKKEIEGFQKKPDEIFQKVADNAAFWQRSRIYLDELKPKNQPMTIRYKGFDHPGFMTGQLVDNIKGKGALL